MRAKMKAVLATATVALLAACGGGGGGAAGGGQETVELRLGHIQSEQDIWHTASLRFAEEVYNLSDGTISVTVFPNSTLGGDRDMGEGMQIGTVDIGLIAGVLGAFEPTVLLLELPYLFDNQEEFDRVIHGALGQEIEENILNSSGIRVLNWWNRGSRQVSSNIPIHGLSDIQGLSIRVPEISAMVETWSTMGASPTPMAWAEVFTALEQGVIDAQENPIPFIHSGSIHEVQSYINITDHKFEYVTMSMAESTWQSLTPEQQAIVQQAADIATNFQNEQVLVLEQELLQDMVDSGVTVIHPNIAELSQAAREAHAPFAAGIDADLFARIMAELGR